MPQELKSFARQYWRRAVEIFFALLLLFQFAGFVSVFSASIDPRSILSSRDADGAHVVGTAARTRWYLDNGETAYGAFYYRAAHTFAEVVGRQFAAPSSENENVERAHYLALMTLALVAVYAMAWLVSALAFEDLRTRMVATGVLVAALLTDPVWARFVWRAHPDMFFGLAVLTAFLLTTRALKRPNERVWFLLSAMAWGVCGMVKLTFVLFLPPLLLLWLPPFEKAALRRAVKYYLWVLVGYLVLGLPQSLNIPRSLRFLRVQSQYGEPVTAQSLHMWISQYAHQLAWPFTIAVILAAVSSRERDLRRGHLLRLAALFAFPGLYLLKHNTTYEMDYYLIPVVALILAWTVLVLRGGLPLAWRNRARPWVVGALAVTVWATVGFVPSTMEAEQSPVLACRDQAHVMYERIHQEIDRGRVMVLDPYVPFDRRRAGERAYSTFGNDWAMVGAHNASGIGLWLPYMERFLSMDEPILATRVDAPNWRDVREYYRCFKGKTECTDPQGNIWRRVFASTCGGYELWLK